MDVSLGDALSVGDQVLFRQLDREAVLLDLRSGTYFGLNEVGARAWHLIVEHGSLARVRDLLVAEYAADPETIERDLIALAGQLVAQKLADVKPNAR